MASIRGGWVESWKTKTILKTSTTKRDVTNQQDIKEMETDDSSDDERDFAVEKSFIHENDEQLGSNEKSED